MMSVLKLLILVNLVPRILTGTCPSTSQVQVQVGHDAILRCYFDRSLNLSRRTLDWTKVTAADGSRVVVHVYEHGTDNPYHQDPGFRGRTTLVHEDLSRGIMTLLLSNVRLSDAGVYNCSVPKGPDSQILCQSVRLEVTNGTEDLRPTTVSPEEDKTPSEAKSPRVAVIAAVCGVVVVIAAFVVKVKRDQIEACWRKCGEMRPVEPEANARQLEALTPPAAAGQNHVANGDVELQVY